MAAFWESLTPPWRACLQEAWAAYCAGCVPIGAVVTDAAGVILARGRNRIAEPAPFAGQVCGTALAHAELNALIQLAPDHPDRHDWILYTTTEPCPLCLGALYMSGLHRCHYASRDPYAGSANLLGTTPYLSRKPVRMFGSERTDLELAIIAIFVAYSLEKTGDLVHDVFRAIDTMSPEVIAIGKVLHGSGQLQRLRIEDCPADHGWETIHRFITEMTP